MSVNLYTENSKKAFCTILIDPNDSLIFVLYGENVFKVDSVLATVDSLEGVRSADVYILTKLQYYDDWIIREIDKRLAPQQLQKAYAQG